MAVISKIEAQKGQKDKYSIFLDGTFALGVHADTLLAHGLKEGMVLDEKALVRLIRDVHVKEAVRRGIQYIGYRQRTKREVADRLERLEYTPDQIKAALDALEAMGLLDDMRYAETFVDTRQSRYGRRRLRLELKARGISDAIADRALDDGFDESKAYETALAFGRKKYAQCDGLSPRKAVARIQGLLLRKGYSPDVVYRVVKVLGVLDSFGGING